MLTPRTSVPVVGVEPVKAAIGSGVVCGVVLGVEDPAERPERDVAVARRDVVDLEVAGRSSALMNAVVSRITEPVPSPFVSALTMPV